MKTRIEAEIEKALLQGKRYDEIAKELRVSAKTIAKVSKKMNELSSSRFFTMLEKGFHPIDIVKDTDADPELIAKWFRAWVNIHEDVLRYEKLPKELLSHLPVIREVDENEREEDEKGKETHTPEYWRKNLEKKTRRNVWGRLEGT